MESARKPVGNILGAGRAEADRDMLRRAFVATADYRALIETVDFNFVVGRRGTGKSALFQKAAEHFGSDRGVLLSAHTPQEHEVLEIQRLLSNSTKDYRGARALGRIAWQVELLSTALDCLRTHYKAKKSGTHLFAMRYAEQHPELFRCTGVSRVISILQHAWAESSAEPNPGFIASHYGLDTLTDSVRTALTESKLRVVVMFDGLDEGWESSWFATSVIGGLAIAAADLTDRQTGVHTTLFVRDNVFRSVAQLDSDFSRHIEPGTLRLHWDSESLLRLVAERLRAALNLAMENDVKLWNRFAQRELRERAGFARCLHYTLYRPRDILVLLNQAYVLAAREGRDSIVEHDVETASTRISQERLDDLKKEYDQVLPGLGLFVAQFRGQPARTTLGNAVARLDAALERHDHEGVGAGDFPLLGSGREIASALYSVGFLGVQDSASGEYRFCHDGAIAKLESFGDQATTVIHPCYWKALDVQGDVPPEQVAIRINDDYDEAPANGAVRDQRTRRVGQILGQLPAIPEGHDGARSFEQWVHTAVQILFAGDLKNVELKPNPAVALEQRDVVATNMAATGFWRRIRDDYGTRQVIFEVKNYAGVRPDDFRQVLSYSGGEYGKFVAVVSRTQSEALDESERDWVKQTWDRHQVLVFVVPGSLLARCLSKLRTAKRPEYTEDQFGKRMDTFIRSYLELREVRRFGRRNRK